MEPLRKLLLSGALGFALCATALAAPPKVVSTSPANGKKDVDPQWCRLAVEFDQDMASNDFSWMVVDKGAFPKAMGKPFWETPRTCVFQVALEPGKKYGFGINTGNGKGFRSAKGEVASPSVVSFKTSGKPTGAAAEEAAQQVESSILQRYSYRDLQKVDWKKAFAKGRKDLKAARDTAAFAKRTAEILSPAKDVHLWLQADGKIVPTHVRMAGRNVNALAIAAEVTGYRRWGNAIATGVTKGGAAYLAIDSFRASRGMDQLDAAVADALKAADGKGLVIDVRMNGGGDERFGQRLAGRFVSKPVVYAKQRFVAYPAKTKSGFLETTDRVLRPIEGAKPFAGKIAVLMGPGCVSSCEGFLLMMKQVSNCKLFGEPSAGASAFPKPILLANGITLLVPSWQAFDAKGKPFEGRGISPSVGVKGGGTKSPDPVLKAATDWLAQ